MSLAPPPVKYALARAGEVWPEGTLHGLAPDPGGDLHLRRVPAVAPPRVGPPGDPGPAGLARDRRCGLYVADSAGSRLLRIGLDDGTRRVVPAAATALAANRRGWLFAATPAGEVRVYSTPGLIVRDVWMGFHAPIALAADRTGLLVVDAGDVVRVDEHGGPDPAFAATMAPPAAPRAVAVADDGTILVGAPGGVWPYDMSGAASGPPLAAGTEPSALTVWHDVIYVGDAASGLILLFGLPDGAPLGAVGDFRHAVTGLAADRTGLYIKTGLDGDYVVALRDSAYTAEGSLVVAGLDAGEESGWARAAARCRVPDAATATLELYEDDVPNPAAIAWRVAPAHDVLLDGRRYLWLRVTLATRNPAVSPTLLQLEARTEGGSYLDHLPYVFGHEPGQPGLSTLALASADPTGFQPGELEYLRGAYARTPVELDFISRLVELARSQLGDLETAIGELPTRVDPASAPAGTLEWLAGWLAFEPPPRLADGSRPDELRALLAGLAGLYRRRGTPRGLADFVELYAGVRPHVLEDFQARPLWLLDQTPLGFGTGLVDRDLEGVLVGESTVGETGPEDPGRFGEAAFAGTAHRFSLLVPPGRRLDGAARALVKAVAEAEKPAHTGFHLCFIQPRMRIGTQARVGLDAVVAAGPDQIALNDTATLGLDTRLPAPDREAPGAVGSRGQIGIDTRVG